MQVCPRTSREEWVLGLSVLLKGGLEEQAEFAFAVYDFTQDGFLSREELQHLLKTSLGDEEETEEGVRDLVHMTIKMMDRDKDGKLSCRDFTVSVLEEPLMLEAFGPCLPSHQVTLEVSRC